MNSVPALTFLAFWELFCVWLTAISIHFFGGEIGLLYSKLQPESRDWHCFGVNSCLQNLCCWKGFFWERGEAPAPCKSVQSIQAHPPQAVNYFHLFKVNLSYLQTSCKHDDSKMQAEENQLVGCPACSLQSRQLSGAGSWTLTWELSYPRSSSLLRETSATRDKSLRH